MDFKIDYGPWESIFNGEFYGHKVEIVMNPEKYFLTLIYDEERGQKKGALIEGYKGFVAKGSIDTFVQTLPKNCLGITKNIGNRTVKMLFLSFEPVYIDFKKEDFTREIDNKIERSFRDIETVNELARASSLELKETAMSPETEYSPILGDPFMAKSLLSGLKKNAMEMLNLSGYQKPQTSNIIQLGLSKKREIIKENSENLYRCLITGGNEKERLYASYIVCEQFLLENKTAIIFDNYNYFDGLGRAAKNENQLKDELIEFEPAGFPLKKYKAKDNLKVSFKYVDLLGLTRMMLVADEKIESALRKIVIDVDTPKEFVEQIKNIEGLTDFQKLKIERIIEIIGNDYDELFGKTISIEELTKKWPGNLGRATIIDVKELNGEEKVVFEGAIMNLMNKEIKGIEKNTIIVLPETEKVVAFGGKKFEDLELELQNKGIGFINSSQKEIQELKNTSTATMQIVSERDVAFSIKNGRNYRVILRPSLSGEPVYS